MDLAVDITKENTYYVVKPAGEIDVYTAPILMEKLLPLTEERGAKIKIDLHETRYLDSTGLGIFINAYKSSKKHGSELKFIHLHDRVFRLFKVTGLYKIMDIERPTE